MDTNETQGELPRIAETKTKRHTVLAVLIVLLLVALPCAAGFGAYHYQQNKLDKVKLQLNKSNQNYDALKSEEAALNKKVADLNSQLKSQASSSASGSQTTTADKLGIKILDAYKYYTTKYPNNSYIVVDVTLTNTDTSSLAVPLSSFNLVDSANNGGTDFGDLAGTTMPNGKAILGDQTLSAGQTVTGALAFSAFSANYSFYTLSYKAQSFSITANTSVNQ